MKCRIGLRPRKLKSNRNIKERGLIRFAQLGLGAQPILKVGCRITEGLNVGKIYSRRMYMKSGAFHYVINQSASLSKICHEGEH